MFTDVSDPDATPTLTWRRLGRGQAAAQMAVRSYAASTGVAVSDRVATSLIVDLLEMLSDDAVPGPRGPLAALLRRTVTARLASAGPPGPARDHAMADLRAQLAELVEMATELVEGPLAP